MADEGFRPVVVENDPAALGFVDDELGQSIDPLLDPQGQSSDPGSDDPAAINARHQLADIGELARAITDDPIPLMVARIHDDIQQLLRLHRDICDGVELAADQVQDKRIEFIEAGPEVTVADVFIEVALVFFLESPLAAAAVKKVIQRAYRFVQTERARRIADKSDMLRRLRAAAEKHRAPRLGVRPDQRSDVMVLQRMELDVLLGLHKTKSAEEAAVLRQRLDAVRRELKQLSRQPLDLTAVDAGTGAAAPRGQIQPTKLQEYFAELESAASEYGVGLIKAGVAGAQKAASPESQAAASDSIGVQLKSLSQFHLRNLEYDLGLAAANADMLRSIAQSDPFLAPDCLALLAEMHGILQQAREPDGKKPELLDARRSVMLEVEKLIWAVLTPDEILDRPELIEELGKLADERPFQDPFLDSFIFVAEGHATVTGGPSPRFVKYLFTRFFPDQPEMTQSDLLKHLKALKTGFLEKGDDERLIDVVSITFRPEAWETGAAAPVES